MARKKSGRANGEGTLERHGRTYRARYFKPDPTSPTGFSRVVENTGIRIDAPNAEEDARKWLEERTAPYRLGMEKGKLTEDKAKLARVLRSTLDATEGHIQGAERDIAEAEDKLPAYSLEAAWTAFDGDLTSRKRDPATHRNYNQWYHLFTAWAGQHHPEAAELRGVTPALAREYAKHLLERVRGTTYNRHLNALALIWATLAARDANGRAVYPDAKLGGNPFAWDKATKSGIPRVKLEKADRPHRRRDLSVEEIAKLLTTATGEYRVLIALGFYTGLRLGDCALMQFAHIDRALGTIRTRSKKTDVETETAIHPRLAQILAENVTTKRGYLMPKLAALYLDAKTGRVELTKRITALFNSCGIATSYREREDERARPDCGFHSLRHAYATQLARAHVAFEDRRRLMGHATDAMTKHYTHEEAGAALALPDVLEAEAVVVEAQLTRADERAVARLVGMARKLTPAAMDALKREVAAI